MTDTPEGAPSKRAMEIARSMQFASETEIARLLDAEFCKERAAGEAAGIEWATAEVDKKGEALIARLDAHVGPTLRSLRARAEASKELAKAVERMVRLHEGPAAPGERDGAIWDLQEAIRAYRGSQP